MSYYKILEQIKLEHEKNLLSTQIEIQENTFQHISREIHDNITLELTLAKLHLNTLDWENLLKVKDQVKVTIEQLAKAIVDLSDISKSLSSEIILNLGLLKALGIELEKIREMDVFQLDFQVKGDPVFLDGNKELVIFRIIQEALNNIIKHAEAKLVELILTYNDDHVTVSITDDGKGFSKERLKQDKDIFSKAGLTNMQKRAAMFNGNATIESENGRGTTIKVLIPY